MKTCHLSKQFQSCKCVPLVCIRNRLSFDIVLRRGMRMPYSSGVGSTRQPMSQTTYKPQQVPIAVRVNPVYFIVQSCSKRVHNIQFSSWRFFSPLVGVQPTPWRPRYPTWTNHPRLAAWEFRQQCRLVVLALVAAAARVAVSDD